MILYSLQLKIIHKNITTNEFVLIPPYWYNPAADNGGRKAMPVAITDNPKVYLVTFWSVSLSPRVASCRDGRSGEFVIQIN